MSKATAVNHVDSREESGAKGSNTFSDFHFSFSSVPIPDGIRVYHPNVGFNDASGNLLDVGDLRKGDKLPHSVFENSYFYKQLEDAEISGFLTYGAGHDNLVRELPRGFYAKQFMKLNPYDVRELLDFQREWGIITGPRALKTETPDYIEHFRPEPDRSFFEGNNEKIYRAQLSGILASQHLFDSAPNAAANEDPFSSVHRLSAVSLSEVITTVVLVQESIRATTRVLRTDLPPMNDDEVINAMYATNAVNRFVTRAFPALELWFIRKSDGKIPNPSYDLVTAVCAQLVSGLKSNDTYRVCGNPECQCVFTPKDFGRRLDSRYCSEYCQNRAKALRYYSASRKRKTMQANRHATPTGGSGR